MCHPKAMPKSLEGDESNPLEELERETLKHKYREAKGTRTAGLLNLTYVWALERELERRGISPKLVEKNAV